MRTIRIYNAIVRRMRPLLGTFVEIAATGNPPRLPAAVAAAFAAVERVQRLMSFHDPRSDVSRINAARPGEIVPIDAETRTVLRAALILGDLSDGAFDIAAAPPVLVRRGTLPAPGRASTPGSLSTLGGSWALGGSSTLGSSSTPADISTLGGEPLPCALPTPCAPPIDGTAAAEATHRDLDLLPSAHVRWRRKGWIDLGGIAKGYAVDRAVETLRAWGIASGVVNAGGDLRCFGEPQPLYLRAGDHPGALRLSGELRDGAAATSAGYYQSDQLVDPARRECVPWGRSITVVARDCMSADALTKVVRLAPDLAPRALGYFGAEAVQCG
jgi:thiamine biosynthesis lipoprotein